MKKVFALMLALCLMLGCTALAENEITWEQIAPTCKGGRGGIRDSRRDEG